MAICLNKGDVVCLDKGINNVHVALNWTINENKNEADLDLDASAFLLNKNGKSGSDDFVFYNHKKHKSGAIWCGDDNKVGGGDGESIDVCLDRVPDYVEKIVFVVSIYRYKSRKQNFGMISDASIEVFDVDNNDELIASYKLNKEFVDDTLCIIGELTYDGDVWEFKALGEGLKGGLLEACERFGIKAICKS